MKGIVRRVEATADMVVVTIDLPAAAAVEAVGLLGAEVELRRVGVEAAESAPVDHDGWLSTDQFAAAIGVSLSCIQSRRESGRYREGVDFVRVPSRNGKRFKLLWRPPAAATATNAERPPTEPPKPQAPPAPTTTARLADPANHQGWISTKKAASDYGCHEMTLHHRKKNGRYIEGRDYVYVANPGTRPKMLWRPSGTPPHPDDPKEEA